MKTLIKTIGVIVFSLMMYSIPILVACSFCLNWDGGIKFMLIITSCAQLVVLCTYVYTEVE